MCARFSRRVDIWVYAKMFDFAVATPTPVGFNIAATDTVDTVRFEALDKQSARRHVPMSWGFLPAWAKDAKTRYVNARSETVSTSKMFRSAFEKRRCLVLADGVIEWQTIGKRKLPFLFTLKDDKPFAFAGIWNRTHIPLTPNSSPAEGRRERIVETCAILTTEPNELFARIHDRMPVLLQPEAVSPWLDVAITDADALRPWLVPYPADAMSMHAISAKVNNARNKGADCLDEASPEAQGELF
jgi:putative SOS response-associated peptidase YedK